MVEGSSGGARFGIGWQSLPLAIWGKKRVALPCRGKLSSLLSQSSIPFNFKMSGKMMVCSVTT